MRDVLALLSDPRLRGNIAWLYGAQAARYALPLVTLPFLARILAPEAFGLLALAQAIGLIVAVVVEYGFDVSATRDVAAASEDPQRRGSILAAVTGAKATLAVLATAAAAACAFAFAALRDEPILVLAALCAGILQGLAPLWFFVALERIREFAVLDVGAKLAAVALTFAFVRGPRDAWLVPAFQASMTLLAVGAAAVLIARSTPLSIPTRRDVADAFRRGAPMFLFRSSATLYTTGNAVLLGIFAAPVAVAMYSGAERIAKGSTSAISPIGQAAFPRVARLVDTAPAEAARLLRSALVLSCSVALALGVALFAFGPSIVQVALGPGYDDAVSVLRILSPLPVLLAVSSLLGLQWMVPNRLDRPFLAIILAAGALNVTIALLLAPRSGASGMAWSVVVAEAFVTVSMLVYLRSTRRDPFSI